MKLKRKILKNSLFQSGNNLETILSELKFQGYRIINRKNNSVTFESGLFNFGSRWKAFSKVDGGTIVVDKNQGITVLVFNYYISYLLEAILILGLAILAFFKDYYLIFLIVPILMQLLVRIISLKSMGEDVIENM